MADKTTTLKNQAGDNIYPNIVGDNRNAAIKDSTTIKHTLAENKISLDLDEVIKGKIDAALQKPTGLTKTKLVGVGTQGQENIEIGDNLTLANGKLSATGGGSGGSLYLEATFDFESNTGSYTGTISSNTIGIHMGDYGYLPFSLIVDGVGVIYSFSEVSTHLTVDTFICQDNVITYESNVFQGRIWSHFITMTNSNDNIALYLTIQNVDDTEFTADTLYSYLIGNYNKVLVNGNLHGVVPTYIAGENGVIKVYYMTPGDSNINPTPDEYRDLSSFTISDKPSQVG